MEEIVTLAGLKEAGYFGLLVGLLYAIYKSGRAVFSWAFDSEHGTLTRLGNKAVETLNQVQTSVAEQSASAKEISTAVKEGFASEARNTATLIEKVERIDRHLTMCPVLHPHSESHPPQV